MTLALSLPVPVQPAESAWLWYKDPIIYELHVKACFVGGLLAARFHGDFHLGQARLTSTLEDQSLAAGSAIRRLLQLAQRGK